MAVSQYEVVLEDGVIAEKEAQALLESSSQHPTYSADFSWPTFAQGGEEEAEDATVDVPSHSYQLMNLSPHRYLCSIPLIQPPGPENETANELARAEEARELSRAATHGWQLLDELEDSCLYFMSGWWSYSFCNNREITQYHALAAVANGQPPRRDPHTAEYVLGRVPTIPATSGRNTQQEPGRASAVPAELQVKGDQRYLVQRLEKGTVCDLTGRERTVEVQYHCVPGMKTARISWIKEVTICAYVMAVHTPRLCNDVAFLPPEETRANLISCQRVVDGEASAPPLIDQNHVAKTGGSLATEERRGEADEDEAGSKAEVTVGGIVVGGRSVLSGADEAGKPPAKLGHPRSLLSRPPGDVHLIEVVVRAASKEEGGKVTVLDTAELEKLDLKPEVVEDMRKQMQKMAGDSAWRLEIVEIGESDHRELRGYIDDDEQEGEGEEGEQGGQQAAGARDEAKGAGDEDKDGSKERGEVKRRGKVKEQGEGEEGHDGEVV